MDKQSDNFNKSSKKDNNCDIVIDLIPLYIDDAASDGSRELVEKHVKNCKECKRVLDISKSPLLKEKEIEESVKYIKVYKEDKKRQKRLNFINSMVCIFVIFLIAYSIYYIYNCWIMGDVSDVKIDIGDSEKYSTAERREASNVIKKYFHKKYKGCKLLELKYDEEYMDVFYEGENVIVFSSTFYTRWNVKLPWLPNEEHSCWRFSVKYNEETERWEVISAGYG